MFVPAQEDSPMCKSMQKILIVLIAMVLAAPLLTACGAPIDEADRPFQDRIRPGYPSTY
jgi:hypothetical protein